MNVLYIANLYVNKNSSAAIRNNALVKGLIELGNKVDVITVRPKTEYISEALNYGNIRYYNLFNYSRRTSVKKAVKNERIKKFLIHCLDLFQRNLQFPDSYEGWTKMVDPTEFMNYDLMISSSDNKISHFVADKIKKHFHELRWIQIWGDPWADDISESFVRKIRIRHYEKKLLQLADKVIFISLPTCDSMKIKYPSISDKIEYVPRSYFNQYKYEVPVNKLLHIVYTGSISPRFGRTLDDLLAAIDRYNIEGHEHNLVVDIYGIVDINILNKISSPNIIIHGCIDVAELESIYKSANAMLYLSNKSESTQIPGKLYDYLGTSSQIVCLVNNTTDAIATFLSSIGEQCLLVVNDKDIIYETLPEIVCKIKKTYEPNISFAPRKIAEKVLRTII